MKRCGAIEKQRLAYCLSAQQIHTTKLKCTVALNVCTLVYCGTLFFINAHSVHSVLCDTYTWFFYRFKQKKEKKTKAKHSVTKELTEIEKRQQQN